MSSDADYFRARAIEERDCAATASEPNIVGIHLNLAEKYEGLVQEAELQPTIRPGWEDTSEAQPA
jgi:hypothetical protein